MSSNITKQSVSGRLYIYVCVCVRERERERDTSRIQIKMVPFRLWIASHWILLSTSHISVAISHQLKAMSTYASVKYRQLKISSLIKRETISYLWQEKVWPKLWIEHWDITQKKIPLPGLVVKRWVLIGYWKIIDRMEFWSLL